jgi:hypothetical protein
VRLVLGPVLGPVLAYQNETIHCKTSRKDRKLDSGIQDFGHSFFLLKRRDYFPRQ